MTIGRDWRGFKLPRRVLCAFALTALATSAQAQSSGPASGQDPAAPATQVGDTAVVVGETVIVRGDDAPITNILTSVDILGGDVAQRENVDNAFAIFARLPGVLTTNFNQATTNGTFSVRGFNGEGGINAVKLMIDGIPTNTNDGFMWMIDQIFPIDIASIELVRGTSDPRYGLHNIAGNANIVTRIGGTFLDAKAMVGSYGTSEGQLAAGLDGGSFSQNYAVGYRRGSGYRDHSDFERLSLSGKWFRSVPRLRVGAIARYYTGDGEEPGFLLVGDTTARPTASYPVSRNDGGERKIAQLSGHLDAQLGATTNAVAKVYVNHYDDTRFVRFTEGISQQERDTNEWQYGGLANVSYRPSATGALHAIALEAGGDVQIQNNRYQRFRTVQRERTLSVFDQDFGLTVGGIYGQAVISPTPWLKLTPAYRADWVGGDFTDVLVGAAYDVNDYGTISQPKLSAVVTPMPGVGIYGNYGRTFQIGVGVASYKIPPRVVDLSPSVNDGWEAGLKYERGILQTRGAVWRQTASGEVQRNDFTGDFQNLGKTRRSGFDLEASVRATQYVTLWGAFSKQHGTIVVPDPSAPDQRGNRIDHVPEYLGSGGLDVRPTSRLRLSTLINGQTAYELDTSNIVGKVGDFFLVNQEVAYSLTPKIEVSAQVKNVANSYYEYAWWDGAESLHAPGDGRAFYVGFRVRP